MQLDSVWQDMIRQATAVQGKRQVSSYIDAGSVAAAVLGASGRIYTGVCVDTRCTLGICAERNAIFQMITAGEDALQRVLAIRKDRKIIPPCGACRELMAQMMPNSYRQIEVMLDINGPRIVSLGELTPDWWIDA